MKICGTCRECFECSVPKIPKLSLAAGLDFGSIDRLGLPPPTLIEELLLSRSRLFVSLVKLVGPTAAQRQLAKQKSHVITFPAPDGPTKLAELQRLNSSNNRATYPRIENLKEHLGVFFIGSRLQYQAMVPFNQVEELQVRVDLTYKYLHILKSINPLYQDIVIDESEAMIHAMEQLTGQLLNIDSVDSTVVLMDEEMDVVNEKVATATNKESSIDLEDQPFYGFTPLQSSFITRLSPLDKDPDESTRLALQGIKNRFITKTQIHYYKQ